MRLVSSANASTHASNPVILGETGKSAVLPGIPHGSKFNDNSVPSKGRIELPVENEEAKTPKRTPGSLKPPRTGGKYKVPPLHSMTPAVPKEIGIR